MEKSPPVKLANQASKRAAQPEGELGTRLPTLAAGPVRFRWLTEADIPALFSMYGDPEVTRYLFVPQSARLKQLALPRWGSLRARRTSIQAKAPRAEGSSFAICVWNSCGSTTPLKRLPWQLVGSGCGSDGWVGAAVSLRSAFVFDRPRMGMAGRPLCFASAPLS